MENCEEIKTEIENKKTQNKCKSWDKAYHNEYHKAYYINKISGEKKLCECGLMVDKFRFARHRLQKNHLAAMFLLQNKDYLENLQKKSID